MGKPQRGRQASASTSTSGTNVSGKSDRSTSTFRALTSQGSSPERNSDNSTSPPSRRQTRQEKKKTQAASASTSQDIDKSIIDDSYKASSPLKNNPKGPSTSKEKPTAAAAKESTQSLGKAHNND